MKVLILQGYLDPLGREPEELLRAWPTLPGVASGVARAGAEVRVFVSAYRNLVMEAEGVSYHFVRERPGPRLRRWLGHRAAHHPARTLRATAAHRADVVHIHGLSFPLQSRAMRRRHPSAALLAQDHADRPPTGLRRALHRWGLATLDGVAFTARLQAAPFHRAAVLRPDVPVYEVPEGSTSFTPGDRGRARQAFAPADPPARFGEPAVAWVGRLTPAKDPLGALEAFAGCAGRFPHARLWMAWSAGELEARVRQRVHEDPRLSERVELLGSLPHDRVELLLRACDVLLTASRREGSGFTVIESLACGTPVAATDIPSHAALLGGTGSLAPVGDAPALGEALCTVAAAGPQGRVAARRRFEQALTFDAIGRDLVAAYESLLARREGRARAPTGRQDGAP